MKNILFVAAESTPFIKTGGLADVIGSLPRYFDKKEYDVRVIMPKYLCIQQKYRDKMSFVGSFHTFFNGRDRYVGLMSLVYEGVTFYFVDNEEYFGGPTPYADTLYDIEKFSFFSLAALSVLPIAGFRPDIIHCHDWHSGLIPVYLKTLFAADSFYAGIKTVMTIHNLRFQGMWEKETVRRITGLPGYLFTSDKLEYYGNANMLKGGITYADKVTTVSETYVGEVQTPFFGEGLDGLLRARSADFFGILNGIDTADFDPQNDKVLFANYDVTDFKTGKKKNKTALQKQLGLDVDEKVMMVGIVSRLTDQKGFDLIQYLFEEMLGDYVQFVILGTGEWKYEDTFKYFAGRFPGKVSANIFYSEELSRRIYAASDAFLMPSLFEPCGLSQLIALRYGSVPVVRETGGLKDTVQAYNEYENTGNGFSFANYNAHEMMGTLRYAESVYYDHKRRWNQMAERAMRCDYSWTASACKYGELYKSL